MPLTVVHRKTLPGSPRRASLEGFTEPRLGLVAADGSVQTGKKAPMSDQTHIPGAPVTRGATRAGSTVTDIGVHRFRTPHLFGQVPVAKVEKTPGRKALVLMGLAAAMPPLVWVGHALLHWFRDK